MKNNESEVEIDVEEKFEDEFKIESENFGTENFENDFNEEQRRKFERIKVQY